MLNTDQISEDVLDDEFIRIFKPTFMFLNLLGMNGVTIKYKFVTPATNLYKTYCCIIWIFNYACVLNCAIRCETRFDALSSDIPLKTGLLLNSFINAVLAWKCVFYRGETYSQLYVKLQKIERILKMKDHKEINKKLSNFTATIRVITVVALIAVFLLFSLYLMEDYCTSVIMASAVAMMNYFQTFIVALILYFLSIRARYLNDMLSQKKDFSQMNMVYFSCYSVMPEEGMVSEELLTGMCYILDCFADVMDLFQLAIFCFTFQMLIWQLISMQNLIASIKIQMSVNVPSFLCTIPASTVYMALMLNMCFVSQSLTTTLEKTKKLCTKLMLSCEGKSRENAKRMIVLLNGKREATVYGIFTLDTQLPVHLFAITATYTIVLLQFATL